MRQTQLSGRAILMVVLLFVGLMGGLMAMTFIVAPSQVDSPSVRRQCVVVSVLTFVLAAAWFSWLCWRAIRDYRHGVRGVPARVSGWFNVCFGMAVAIGGVVCTTLSFQNSTAENAGFWTLYWGMIVWGCIQAVFGVLKVQRGRSNQIVETEPSIGRSAP